MKYSVIIVAAGLGSRMGLGYNKMFYQIADNTTIIDQTIQCFRNDQECSQIIVVTNESEFELLKHHDDILLVCGGATRQQSVYNGLTHVNETYVMIHDGARPYLSIEALIRIKECLKDHDACLLTVPTIDTIKIMGANGLETLDRSLLRNAQTPQAFKTAILVRAYAMIDDQTIYSDDTSIVEKVLGLPICNVEGDYKNIKITTMEDIVKLR